MKEIHEELKKTVIQAVNAVLKREKPESEPVLPGEIVVETPPDPELGDIAFPMFTFAKKFRTAPAAIAGWVKEELEKSGAEGVLTSGGYVNIKLDRPGFINDVLSSVKDAGDAYGRSDSLAGKKVMIEFSCPNTNKPLHLGHLRNDAIGESISRIIDACGAEVRKVNLINDRGIHICKSMLAYQKFGEGKTPEGEGIKSDHFVGDYYVAYDKWVKQDPAAEEQARELLRKWEQGDEETVSLWKQMNTWAIEGIEKTYEKTDVGFDTIYYESRTYSKGRDEVLKGLEKEIFFKDEKGTVWVDLTDAGLDKKVLLRGDGTSLYVTQDIGTAIQRSKDWPFDKMIYVVASEQQYHFKVLFRILGMLGYGWADDLHHLSYGMVNLPEGKMKSREGTVVDADDLLEELSALALREITEKGREEEVSDPAGTAEKIALGALHFYLLQATPFKDMIFLPEKSIAFNGMTGPYLQYTCARISSMMRKYQARANEFSEGIFNPALLTNSDEWEIIKMISRFPGIVEQAAEELNPSLVAGFLYDLAKVFSHYYHDNPILHNEDKDLVVTRITLADAVLRIMNNGLSLINVPFLSSM